MEKTDITHIYQILKDSDIIVRYFDTRLENDYQLLEMTFELGKYTYSIKSNDRLRITKHHKGPVDIFGIVIQNCPVSDIVLDWKDIEPIYPNYDRPWVAVDEQLKSLGSKWRKEQIDSM